MLGSTPRPAQLRRATAAVAATALATLPATASAQTSPEPVDIDQVCAAAPDTDRFDDVAAGDPVAEPVRCLAHARITQGVTADRYAPDRAVSRAEMASFVARTADVASVLDPDERIALLPPTGQAFHDVDPHSPHFLNVVRITGADITEGGPGSLPADRYGPERTVSRGQMASFVVRTLELLTGTPLPAGGDRFPDDEGNVHEGAIDALAEAGVVQGYDDGRFRPEAAVSRGEMAWYLTRALGHLHEQGAVEPLPASVPPRGAEASTVSARYGFLGPDVAVAPNSGEHGTAGSGCRPGDDERLPDGVWMAHIAEFTASDLALDLLCYTTVESGEPRSPDYELTNDDDLVRRMPVAADARFFLLTYPPVVPVGTPVDFWRFADPLTAGGFAADRGYHDGPGFHAAWVLVEGGEVVEVYTPPLDSA